MNVHTGECQLFISYPDCVQMQYTSSQVPRPLSENPLKLINLSCSGLVVTNTPQHSVSPVMWLKPKPCAMLVKQIVQVRKMKRSCRALGPHALQCSATAQYSKYLSTCFTSCRRCALSMQEGTAPPSSFRSSCPMQKKAPSVAIMTSLVTTSHRIFAYSWCSKMQMGKHAEDLSTYWHYWWSSNSVDARCESCQ